MKEKFDVSAIIVTFNPMEDKINELVKYLIVNCREVIIVDNNSNFKFFLEGVYDAESVRIIALKENVGIAAAQNIGLDECYKYNSEFCVFFDQDSIPNDVFFEKMFSSYTKLVLNSKKVILGPSISDGKTGRFFDGTLYSKSGKRTRVDVSSGKKPKEVTLIISSGTFLSKSAMKEIGYMNSLYFIDFVDNEWCFRAISLGYKIFMHPEAIIYHSLGDETIKLLKYNIPVHNAFRRYYKTRNSLWLFRCDYISKAIASREFITNMVHTFFNIVLASGGLEQFKSFIKGIKDGLFKYGR